MGNKNDVVRSYEKVNDRWEIAAGLSNEDKFEQISFVNGISTIKGGKHIDHVVNNITKKLCDFISKKKKIIVKPTYVKEHLFVFVKCTIDNPCFDSQTKEALTSAASKFGSKCDISDKFITNLAKTGIIEKVISLTEFKDANNLKKTDGKKKHILRGIPKLDDANWAGSSKSKLCTLILTEGDSAKALAMAGIEIRGRD